MPYTAVLMLKDAFPRHGWEISQNCLWEDACMVDFTPKELMIAKNVWCFALTLSPFIRGSQSTLQMLTEGAPQYCVIRMLSMYQFQPIFLVKSLTPLWFSSPRMSLHSAPRRSRKGETDSCRLLKDFPDTRKETLHYSLALPLMQMGLKATDKMTTKDRPYTTCC